MSAKFPRGIKISGIQWACPCLLSLPVFFRKGKVSPRSVLGFLRRELSRERCQLQMIFFRPRNDIDSWPRYHRIYRKLASLFSSHRFSPDECRARKKYRRCTWILIFPETFRKVTSELRDFLGMYLSETQIKIGFRLIGKSVIKIKMPSPLSRRLARLVNFYTWGFTGNPSWACASLI